MGMPFQRIVSSRISLRQRVLFRPLMSSSRRHTSSGSGTFPFTSPSG